MVDLVKFEKYANKAIRRARKENKIYEQYLIPFSKKIGLHKKSKTFEEAGNKAIKWALEKAKYKIYS